MRPRFRPSDTLSLRKEPQILPALVAHLTDPELREALRRVLSNQGPAVEPELLKALAKPDPKVQETVCRLLSGQGTAASLEPLRRIIDDPDPTLAKSARQAVKSIEQRGARKAASP